MADHRFVGTMVSGTVDGRSSWTTRRSSRCWPGPSGWACRSTSTPACRRRPCGDAYYSGLPQPLDFALATFGFGWHAETAVHVLRLVFSGTLDRHPGLNLIIGHMGEFLPMAMARTDRATRDMLAKHSARSVAQQLRDQVYVTTSGLFTVPPLQVLLATFGVDRVMFSVDYPFSGNDLGRAFLDALPLAPADVAKIAHGNADRVLGLSA